MRLPISHAILIAAIVMCSTTQRVSAMSRDAVAVADGIYMIKGVHEQMNVNNMGAIGNSGFIVGANSVAVIDPGGSPAAGESLIKAIRAVTDLPVSHVVLTHFHPDHVAGLAAFSPSLQIVAHENYGRAMTQRAQFYLERFADILPSGSESVFKPPTRTVPIGQTLYIDLGDRQLSIEAHPLAHTDNDLTVLDQKTSTLWVSDLLFSERTPALDGSLTGWLDVLSTLDARSYDLVIPGHGSPGSWTELATPQITYLQDLRSGIRTALDGGMALSEVLRRHETHTEMRSEWALYPAQHASNLAKAYVELEWE